MYLVVQMIVAKFAAIWTGLLSFETSNTAFNVIVDEIRNDVELQKQILLGYARTKKEKKGKMARAAGIVCRKVRAYSSGVKDTTLNGNMRYNYSMIYYGTSQNAINYSTIIMNAALAVPAADKTTYGITDGELTALKDLINDFTKFVATPRAEIVNRKFTTSEVNKKFKQANALLRDDLDNVMANFMESNPDFYAQYFDARRIVDLQRHTVLEGNVTDENGTDLKKVKIKIVGRDKTTNAEVVTFEEVTDKNGNYAKSEINPELDYDMTFELDHYQKVEKKNVDITRGEHELVDVVMVKVPTA